MLTSLADRAYRGAEYLDHVRPGWAREIDVDALDVHKIKNCVLGQLFGTYEKGVYCLGISCDQEYAFGFALRLEDTDCPPTQALYYQELTEQWRWEIRERLDTTV